MDRRVVGRAPLLIAVVMLVLGASSGTQGPLRPAPVDCPRLNIDNSVAPDLEALARGTWDQFLSAFQERSDCFGDVYVFATKSLGSRAGYDPDSATVSVRVPGTPAMLKSALVHEWAHHVEFQCEEHNQLKRAFLVAEGLPADTTWRPDALPPDLQAGLWAGIPSERYAEATVVFVLGTRHIPTKVHVTEEMVRVIAEWAGGKTLTGRAEDTRGY